MTQEALQADDMIQPDADVESIAQTSTDFIMLTPIRQSILIAMLDDLQSESQKGRESILHRL